RADAARGRSHTARSATRLGLVVGAAASLWAAAPAAVGLARRPREGGGARCRDRARRRRGDLCAPARDAALVARRVRGRVRVLGRDDGGGTDLDPADVLSPD